MTNSSSPKVVLGMSGGVDSSTSARLLADQGYEVIGVTLKFQQTLEADQAIADAQASAKRLNVKHFVVEADENFERKVVEPFVDSYAQGLTPSPCVLCNKYCKIPELIAVADEQACEYVATGHYVQTARLDNGRWVIRMAQDPKKDQSYMLSQLSQEQIARLVFPLGGRTKTQVRSLAHELSLEEVADKPESQDICFIKESYIDFLHDAGVSDKPGKIVSTEGEVLGTHEGLFRYTIGQRKGIGIAASRPYYVVAKRSETNELVVGFAEDALVSRVVLGSVNWQAFEELHESIDAHVKLRYRSQAVPCTISYDDKGRVVADLHEPQPTTAPGQFAVFYQDDLVLGGGEIAQLISATGRDFTSSSAGCTCA